MNRDFKMVYSNSLDEMVIAKFYTLTGEEYEWNDEDCLYYNVGSDEDWFMEVPNNALPRW